MQQIAGRWGRFVEDLPNQIRNVSSDPGLSALAVGTGAAGAATLGNIASGQIQHEGLGRTGLEALGAGALGALAGTTVPSLRRATIESFRNSPQAGERTRPIDIGKKPNIQDKWREDVEELLGKAQGVYNSKLAHQIGAGAAVAGAGLGAGALGGQVGGGISNIGNMAGIPGLQPNTIVDPEAYGSSNLRVY